MLSRDLLAALRADGWEPVAQNGSHIHLKHLVKAGRVTVPHPNRDLPIGTLKSIERQAQIKFEIAMRQYIALIHKDAGSDYGVSFPDLPGCVTAGVDLDDARRMAEDALALHLAGMAEEEEPIPEPSSLEAVMADRENRDAVAILVRAPPAATKAVRVNMTIPEDELERIDKFAAEHGYTRSGFFLRAAKEAMVKVLAADLTAQMSLGADKAVELAEGLRKHEWRE